MNFKKAIKKVMSVYNVKEMTVASRLWRKNLVRYSLYMLFLVGALTVFAVQNIMLSEKIPPYQSSRYKTDLKYILFWKPENARNLSKGRYEKLAEGQNIFIDQNCKHVNCYISYNKHLLKDKQQNFDAIVYNVRDIIHVKTKEFKLKRSPNQLYIFRSLDSSDLYPVCHKIFDNFFNWTWTYKLNSDIPHPFFNIHDVKNQLVGPRIRVNWTKYMEHKDRFNNITKSKSKAIAWITNCKLKDKYQEFVSELKNEMKGYNSTLDTFGPCGENKCPGGNITKCHKMIEKHYYFQLVLENSLAVDYVTEKVGTAMSYAVIPIILGMSRYNRFLPPGSYLNAQAFNMKKLGAIVDYLMKNPKFYLNFFDWKNHYHYTLRPKRDMCGLCGRLNDDTNVTQKTYNHLRKWWNYNYKDSCRNLKIENIFFLNTP